MVFGQLEGIMGKPKMIVYTSHYLTYSTHLHVSPNCPNLASINLNGYDKVRLLCS